MESLIKVVRKHFTDITANDGAGYYIDTLMASIAVPVGQYGPTEKPAKASIRLMDGGSVVRDTFVMLTMEQVFAALNPETLPLVAQGLCEAYSLVFDSIQTA